MENEKLPQPNTEPERIEPEMEEEQDTNEQDVSDAKKAVASTTKKTEECSTSRKAQAGIPFLKKISVKTYIAAILAMVAVILVLIFAFHKNFRVNEIHISGNQRVSNEAILAAAQIEKNDHLLSHVTGSWNERIHLKDGDARQRIIDSDPYIADASVYPKYPGEIYIDITERRKVAYVAIPDGYAIISDDSVVLDIVSGDVPSGIPEIRGLPILSAQIGQKLEMSSTEGYDICITVLGAILNADSTDSITSEEFDFLSWVISVRYCDNMTTFIDIQIPNANKILSVKIGSLTTISDDMNWLQYAVFSGYFDDKEGTVFDMTGKEYILR